MIPELVCPLCRVPLEQCDDDGRRCPTCTREYPRVAGILDLRVGPDPYLSLDEDRQKARELASIDGGLVDVLRAYWARTPEVPADLAERYTLAALDGPRRGAVHVRQAGVRNGTLLDVGCNAGGLLVAAATAGAHPVGVDIALRWLVVAARAMAERELAGDLVAADGALLPFSAGSFDTVTCIETLEHTRDRRGLLHSCLAAKRTGGTAYLVTANRFSLVPEPTVRLWGVGLLTRPAATRYVAWRRHTRYEHFRATSVSELRALLGPQSCARIGPSALPASPVDSSFGRLAAERAYAAARSLVPTRVMRWVSPYLEVIDGPA